MRAALPFRSRRSYSFARRTFADFVTSTFWIVGECRGKMRSTPWPNDTLRTVNDARVPPRWTPMTTPSKIWMRSLSPSRTFTWTRTVSPDFIAGRSANCDFSTSSIAPMIPRLSFLQLCGPAVLQFSQNLFLFFVQNRAVQQVRPPLERPCRRLALPPATDFGVVSRKQDVGNLQDSRS